MPKVSLTRSFWQLTSLMVVEGWGLTEQQITSIQEVSLHEFTSQNIGGVCKHKELNPIKRERNSPKKDEPKVSATSRLIERVVTLLFKDRFHIVILMTSIISGRKGRGGRSAQTYISSNGLPKTKGFIDCNG